MTTKKEKLALYDAMNEFKKSRCWEHMFESDVFGVHDPESGITGYCSVMGSAGEFMALAVYMGSEGLSNFYKILGGAANDDPGVLLSLQDSMLASLEDREFIHKEDLQEIKELELKFRGRNAWPFFRRHKPCYYPQRLTDAEIRFLTICLHQTVEMSKRLEEDPELLDVPPEGPHLIRVPKKKQNSGSKEPEACPDANLEWKDSWQSPKPFKKKEFTPEPVNEKFLKRLKKQIIKQEGIWQTHYFLFPQPIEDETPYFPQISVWLDNRSKMILHTNLDHPKDILHGFAGQFTKLIITSKKIPKQLHVERDDLMIALQPLTEALGIKLRKVDKLDDMVEVRESFMEIRGDED